MFPQVATRLNAADLRTRRRKPLAAGMVQPEISSFRLALAAEGKAAKTVRNYTEAVQWFAAVHLLPNTFWTRWEQVSGQDVQWWMVWLLARYSDNRSRRGALHQPDVLFCRRPRILRPVAPSAGV